MSSRPILLTTITLAASVLWGACGGGSSAAPTPTPTPTIPTISSFAAAGGNTGVTTVAATGTTNVSVNSTYALTFDTAMTASTVNASTVTLACGSTAETLTVAAASSADTAFTLTPAAAFPPLTDCTATVSTGVESSSSGALAATATYAYTTGCITDDNFSNANTESGCWTTANTTAGVTAFGISGGAFDMTMTGTTTDSGPVAYKNFSNTITNLVATVKITWSGISTHDDDQCGLQFVALDPQSGVSIGITTSAGAKVSASNNTGGQSDTVVAALPTYYFRLTLANGTITSAYSTDGSTYTDLGNGAFTFTPGAGNILIGIGGKHGSTASNTVTCSFDDFTVTGASATGQD